MSRALDALVLAILGLVLLFVMAVLGVVGWFAAVMVYISAVLGFWLFACGCIMLSGLCLFGLWLCFRFGGACLAEYWTGPSLEAQWSGT